MASTSSRQDEDFIKTVIDSRLLEASIDYITANFSVDEIYKDSDLEAWAEANGYIKEE